MLYKIISYLAINFLFVFANMLLYIASKGMAFYDENYIDKFKDNNGYIQLPYFRYVSLTDKALKCYIIISNIVLVILILIFNIGWIIANYVFLFLVL